MSVLSRRALGGAAAVLLTSRMGRAADRYPSKFIRLVLPFAPGGGTDALSRIVGQKLSEMLKQPIVIDNRPGAAGNIATKIVATAPKDGYTLLLGVNTQLVVNPALYPDFDVNVQRDLTPIGQLAEALFVLCVVPTLPINSVAQLIAYARANPGKLNYTSAGVGSPTHLAVALFANRTGIELTHLPFKSGTQAVNALLTGEAQMDIGSLPTCLPYIQTGQLRALAVSSLTRAAALPELPTLNESGLPGYEVLEWYGLMAPSGTPAPVLDTLGHDLLAALQQPDLQTSMAREGVIVTPASPADLRERMKRETVTWAELIKQADIRPE